MVRARDKACVFIVLAGHKHTALGWILKDTPWTLHGHSALRGNELMDEIEYVYACVCMKYM